MASGCKLHTNQQQGSPHNKHSISIAMLKEASSLAGICRTAGAQHIQLLTVAGALL
jgi:hypothetical protein